MADVGIGTEYDMARKNALKATPLDVIGLNRKLAEIKNFVKHNQNTYYMLLCKEQSNYTLFNIQHKDNLDFFISELREVLLNRGQIISISKAPYDNAFEIWFKREDTDNIKLDENEELAWMYYFFPYDSGVLEI